MTVNFLKSAVLMEINLLQRRQPKNHDSEQFIEGLEIEYHRGRFSMSKEPKPLTDQRRSSLQQSHFVTVVYKIIIFGFCTIVTSVWELGMHLRIESFRSWVSSS